MKVWRTTWGVHRIKAVKVDGCVQHDVIWADREAGEVKRFHRGHRRHFMRGQENLGSEIITGTVEFVPMEAGEHARPL